MSEPKSRKSPAIVLADRVVLRDGAFDMTHQHLRSHWVNGDIGTVVEPSHRAFPHWLNVRFDRCRKAHRLAEEEVLLVPPADEH